MQQIACTFVKVSNNAILVKTEQIIQCPGLQLELIPYTPLILSGDYISSYQFQIVSVKLNTADTDHLIKLFMRRNFKQIGQARAKIILNQLRYAASDLGYEDFSQLSYEEYIDVLRNTRIPDETAEKIALLFSGLNTRLQLYNELANYGASFADADKLFNKFHTGALDILTTEPYQAVDCGLSLEVCDRIAKNNHTDYLNPMRLNAIGTLFSKYIETSGSCCITYEQGLNILSTIQNTKIFPQISPLTIFVYLITTGAITVTHGSQYGTLIYPKKLLSIEEQIVNELFRLNSMPVSTGFTQYSGDWAPDADQLEAIGLVKTTGVKIVTGGPGTGKTTTIKEIIREYTKHSNNNNVLLCAPTGAAAARINQSMDNKYRAKTIHKLLDVRKITDEEYWYIFNKNHPLPVGLYIIDEMSMVGEEIFLHLISAIPIGSVVILTGDVDQLQSISSGTVLKDVIEAKVFETVRLNTVHRQQEDSKIVTNYYHVRDNQGFLESGADFTIDLLNDPQERLTMVAKYYALHKRQCQILTVTNKGFLGKERLNYLITDAFAKNQPRYKHTPFHLGDKIMMLVNNYDKGYFNGDVGFITQIHNDHVMVQFYDGLLELTDEDLLHAEHAWSCTIHKSQGSEYENVIMIIDDEYSNMLYRAILLTGITRARKNVHIISTQKALTTCLQNNQEQMRVTGLTHLLKQRAQLRENNGE